MPGGRDSVGGGVWATDYRRGSFQPVAAEGAGSVLGLWGGDGDWLDGRSHEDATWVGVRGKTDLGSFAPGQGTTDVLDGLSDRRRTAELPG